MAFYIVEFYNGKGEVKDLQLPDFLTGDELVRALQQAYELDIDLNNSAEVYLRAENPIALIAGSRTLQQIGISNGTGIYFEARRRRG